MKIYQKTFSILLISFIVVSGIVKAESVSTPFPCGTCSKFLNRGVPKGKVIGINGDFVTCPNCKGTGEEPSVSRSTDSRENVNRSNNQQKSGSLLQPAKFPEEKCKACGGKGGHNTTFGWVTCEVCKGKNK